MRIDPEKMKVVWTRDSYGAICFKGFIPEKCYENDISGVYYSSDTGKYKLYGEELIVSTFDEFIELFIDAKIDEALANRISWKMEEI